jgi:hypothetical protein
MTNSEMQQTAGAIGAYFREQAAARNKKPVRPEILDSTPPADPARAAEWRATRDAAHEQYIGELLATSPSNLSTAQQAELVAAIREFQGR